MVFLEFRLKFTKFWGYLWISSHTEHFLQDFQCRPWGVCGYFLDYPIADHLYVKISKPALFNIKLLLKEDNILHILNESD